MKPEFQSDGSEFTLAIPIPLWVVAVVVVAVLALIAWALSRKRR
jgi:hypothetical protein